MGGGIAGLTCARELQARGVPFRVLEAARRIGGRIKTDVQDGFRLDRGFQVLQTAYPEARRLLDYDRLDLRPFAPGAMIRVQDRFYTVADPLRQPGTLIKTLVAPIGSLGDRLRLLRLARRVTSGGLDRIFEAPEQTAVALLRSEGFSNHMITRFFKPFFGGVCLDPAIQASSRVLAYVLRMFATGDAALPAKGMEQIPRQLAAGLPDRLLQTGVRARAVRADGVILDDGTTQSARAVVVATEAPETNRLLDRPGKSRSIGETCLYFACDHAAWHPPYLMLNGEETGLINNLVFPSVVSPDYAPPDRSLVGVVVLGIPDLSDNALIAQIKKQLVDWFGAKVASWEHLRTYRIGHALPDQSPPTPNPTRPRAMVAPGIFVCGEHGSLPGIQWAMVSGRRAAQAVEHYLS